jgi:hypothetical protein
MVKTRHPCFVFIIGVSCFHHSSTRIMCTGIMFSPPKYHVFIVASGFVLSYFHRVFGFLPSWYRVFIVASGFVVSYFHRVFGFLPSWYRVFIVASGFYHHGIMFSYWLRVFTIVVSCFHYRCFALLVNYV